MNMGRYLAIGIRIRAEVNKDVLPLKESIFHLDCPPGLFDYSNFGAFGILNLGKRIKVSDILAIRKSILEICDLSDAFVSKDGVDESEILEAEAATCRSIAELERIAENDNGRVLYSFRTESRPWLIGDDEVEVTVNFSYFIFYISPFKYYTENGYSMDRTTMMIEKAIKANLVDNVLSPLVSCFITL